MVEPYKGSNTTNPEDIQTFSTDYMITRQKDLLVIDQTGFGYTIGAAHGWHLRRTFHIDSVKAEVYGLKDLFKPESDIFGILSKTVSEMMKKNRDEMGYLKDHADVTPETCFAVGEKGLTLYFGEYEIAPYAAGLPEFFIPFSDLSGYINYEGDFWKSFN
jgi:hypothetical protein